MKKQMKKQINEIKRMQQLAGLIKESQLREERTPSLKRFLKNENLDINNLPPDIPALGILWRLATYQDNVSSEYVWIKDNVFDIVTQLFKSLGEKDDVGIKEAIFNMIHDLGPEDYDINGTVQEFLQNMKEDYKEYGL